MLATVLHLHRGTPFIYQGEELGMTNAPLLTAEELHDVESRNHFRHVVDAGADAEAALASMRPMARDNARTPMQWDSSRHAGFTRGTPWAAVNPNYPEVNAEAARTDRESVFHHYRRLIELRHKEPCVVDGDFTMLLPDDERVYAFTRRLAGTELLVLGNFTGDYVEVPLPSARGWASSEILLSNAPEPTWTLGGVALQPWQAVVHRRHS